MTTNCRITVMILCISLASTCAIAFGKYSSSIIRHATAINPQDSEYGRKKLLENVIVRSEIDGRKYDAAAAAQYYGPRMKTTEREPGGADYDDTGAIVPNVVPSIRDAQHGPLWGTRYMSGGDGKGMQMLNLNRLTKNKNDVALPAYCNPPNPCPVGYTNKDGCTTDFENTAAFSRDYQESQKCLCDSEHMFDCSKSKTGTIHSIDMDEFVRQLQVDDDHKSLVAKNVHVKKVFNPYLQGEFLPIAAKKGINIGF